MTAWRLVTAAALFGFLALPPCWPFGELFLEPDSPWESWQHFLTPLLGTLILVAGVLVIAIPLGLLLAWLLFRTNLPGRSLARGLILLWLFIPPALVLSAWQGLIGSDGWLPTTWWGVNTAGRWTSSLPAAIWVHVWIGVSWVVLILGLGLSQVERDLEELGALQRSPWGVFWRITLPRCRGSIVTACLWLFVQVAGETSVVYFLQIPTFAEEIHRQNTSGNPAALARALAAALPWIVGLWILLVLALPRLELRLPALASFSAEGRIYSLGGWKLLGTGAAVLLMSALVLPTASWFWRIGLAGYPAEWSIDQFTHQMLTESRLHVGVLTRSWLVAIAVGVATTVLALWCCWLARDSRAMRYTLLLLVCLLWALPAPVLGIGLKRVIAAIVELDPDGPMARAIYYGPSPLPLVWAHILRLFPFAVAILWPFVRLLPRDPFDQARLQGAGPLQEFCLVAWPLTKGPRRWAFVAVAALSLGEIAASNRVETPGWDSFVKVLFDRMHYGVDANVAALCLLLLFSVAGLGGIVAIIRGIRPGDPPSKTR